MELTMGSLSLRDIGYSNGNDKAQTPIQIYLFLKGKKKEKTHRGQCHRHQMPCPLSKSIGIGIICETHQSTQQIKCFEIQYNKLLVKNQSCY
jgi:hypothetical protein